MLPSVDLFVLTSGVPFLSPRTDCIVVNTRFLGGVMGKFLRASQLRSISLHNRFVVAAIVALSVLYPAAANAQVRFLDRARAGAATDARLVTCVPLGNRSE